MRSCGTCTKCCDGWLSGEVRGHSMYPGKPCFFVTIGVGCNDYENRPENPCKDFRCVWLVDDEIPESKRPDLSNIVVTYAELDGIYYTRLVSAGDKLDKDSLDWYISFYKDRSANIWFDSNGTNYVIGTEEFINKTVEKGYGTIRY